MMNLIKELLFPRRCPVCDEPVKIGQLICPECQNAFKLLNGQICMKCGKKIDDEKNEYCHDCAKKKHYFERGRALFEYSYINRSIYRFKYSGRQEYADYYAYMIAKHLGPVILSWKPEMIIPVPLHKSKLRIRGYNQSALIAKELSKLLNIPYCEKTVIRKRKTVPMKELNGGERQINLKNAFNIGNYDVKLKKIVIVDDIYTTGCTIDEIAKILKENGAAEVYFVTLSIGRGM